MKKQHFLIVDDDALVCRATARMIEYLTGGGTDCCHDGGEALRLFQGNPEGYACVVTDFEMPGMNGLELGDRLRAAAPGVRMLLVTGNPGRLDATVVKRRGFDCVLVKPFDLTALGEALRGIAAPVNDGPDAPRWRSIPGAALFFERSRGTLHAVI